MDIFTVSGDARAKRKRYEKLYGKQREEKAATDTLESSNDKSADYYAIENLTPQPVRVAQSRVVFNSREDLLESLLKFFKAPSPNKEKRIGKFGKVRRPTEMYEKMCLDRIDMLMQEMSTLKTSDLKEWCRLNKQKNSYRHRLHHHKLA